jgi:hypothetical protein
LVVVVEEHLTAVLLQKQADLEVGVVFQLLLPYQQPIVWEQLVLAGRAIVVATALLRPVMQTLVPVVGAGLAHQGQAIPPRTEEASLEVLALCPISSLQR